MKMSRRAAASTILAMLAAPTSLTAWGAADAWPTRTVRIIATSPPGGSIDMLARLVAEECSKTFGQPFVVENHNGANGTVGANRVVKAAPEGYDFFVTIPGVFAINQYLYSNLPFDTAKDIEPVAYLGSAPLVLVVPSAAPPKTFAEFLSWVRAHPGKFAYSSQGVGNTGHLAMELLKQMAGLDILHVPYKGSAAALNDLLAGNVQMTLLNAPSALPHIQKGTLRALAVSEKKRLASLPDVPTIDEAGVPGYEVIPWWGLGTRTGVPREIIDKMNAAATRAMTRPENQQRLEAASIIFSPKSPDAFKAFVAEESHKWSAIVKASGAKATD